MFYNGITNEYILVIEGLCSIDLNTKATAFNVVCKTGKDEYKRHTLILSDKVTAFSEQIGGIKVDPYHYRVTFKPSVILPDIDVR